MAILEVIRTIVISFQPLRYRDLLRENPKKIFRHMSIFIVAIFLFSSLLSLPKVFSLQEDVKTELGKVQKLDIKGDVKITTPITLTGGIVIDTSDTNRIITTEKVLITKDTLYFNFFRPMKIKLDRIFHPLNYKSQFASTIVLVGLLVMPSVILAMLGLFLAKYILLTFIAGTAIFLALRVLLLIRIRPRNVFNICFLAAIPPAVMEGAISPFFPKLLVPLFGILTFKLSLIPLLAFAGLIIAGMLFSEKDVELFKKRDGEEKLEWGF